MPAEIEESETQRPQVSQPSHHPQPHRWTVKLVARGLAAFVVGAAGVAWGAFEKFGPYWPTEPKIEPGTAASSESSPVSPFTVRNSSVLFPMENGQFTCFLNGALFKVGDEKGWVMARVAPTKSGTWWTKSDATTVTIPANKTANYICGADNMISDVHLNNESARLRGLQVKITLDYTVRFLFFSWRRRYDSEVFTCDVSAGKCLWTIGEIYH